MHQNIEPRPAETNPGTDGAKEPPIAPKREPYNARIGNGPGALDMPAKDVPASVKPAPVRPGDMSPVLLPVGTKSPNGNVMLGGGGKFFLVEGSNGLLAQYGRTASEVAPDVGRWRALVAARRDHAASVGAALFQTIVPEQLSVVPHLFPDELRTPTAMFGGVEAALTELLGDRYVSVIGSLEALGARAVRPGDSHLTPEGSCALARRITGAIAPGVSIAPEFSGTGKLAGDLLVQMFNMPIEEHFATPSENWFPVPTLISRIEPRPNRHMGLEEHWENPAAQIDRSILVFGNSFFATEAFGPAHLGWWFARLFREYHFVWSPGYFAETVTDLRPDIVLCQTIERFLPTVPVDSMQGGRGSAGA
ncbi:MAG TPA: hypothetical protein PK286_07675 [Devosia sp.]|nr:hypothetical protein [Devosia sp.]